ncbi:MAG: sodium/solute symporter [Cytophagales bacterium]
MQLLFLDYIIFLVFILSVGIYVWVDSKKHHTIEEYFLSGRRMTWPIIGLSLVASNISSEHFVGMAGEGYKIGLPIASYEWTASLVMVVVALFVLPKFMRAGIYTLPEYLEYRYGKTTRLLVSIFMLLMYVFVLIASVLYSGALAVFNVFGLFDKSVYIIVIGLIALMFTVYGGLYSVMRTNVVFGIALLAGGAATMIVGVVYLGGFDEFTQHSSGKLHSLLPADNKELPWTNVMLGALWILHLNYWAVNQFITQHSLATSSLSEGQKGILFAATIKLFIPFVIVFPGVIAFELFEGAEIKPDDVYASLMSLLVPHGMKGILLCILMGAVLSTLHSMIHAASMIFTLDIYKRYIRQQASENQIVNTGKIFASILVFFSCLWAVVVFESFEVGIYRYIQILWGLVAPSFVIIFLFGFIVKRATEKAANYVIFLNPIIYIQLLFFFPKTPFLDLMGITFVFLLIIFVLLTLYEPLQNPPMIPERFNVKFERNLLVFIWGIFIFLGTLMLYVVFL